MLRILFVIGLLLVGGASVARADDVPPPATATPVPATREPSVPPPATPVPPTREPAVEAAPPASVAPAPSPTADSPTNRAIQGPRPLQRRWSRWKPWALVAGGAVFAGVGVGLFGVTSDRYDTYDRAVADFRADSSNPPNAVLPENVRVLEDDARAMRAVTVSAFAVGGVMIATGITLAVMNTPRRPPVVVAPQAGLGKIGLVLSGQW